MNRQVLKSATTLQKNFRIQAKHNIKKVFKGRDGLKYCLEG